MDIRLALIAGIDIPIPEIQATIHQPTIKEIAYIGEEEFFIALQFLCLNKEQLIEDKNLLDSVTNFQVLMSTVHQDGAKQKKQAVIQLLTILFPLHRIAMTPSSIILMGENQQSIVDETNFEILQDYLKQILCYSSLFAGASHGFNPGNDAAKEIAKKLMRGRQKVAEQNQSAKESVLTRYVSILSVSTDTIQNVLNLTLYQLYDLIERYMLYVSWDIDVKARLQGASPDHEAENWMKNIH